MSEFTYTPQIAACSTCGIIAEVCQDYGQCGPCIESDPMNVVRPICTVCKNSTLTDDGLCPNCAYSMGYTEVVSRETCKGCGSADMWTHTLCHDCVYPVGTCNVCKASSKYITDSICDDCYLERQAQLPIQSFVPVSDSDHYFCNDCGSKADFFCSFCDHDIINISEIQRLESMRLDLIASYQTDDHKTARLIATHDMFFILAMTS